MRIIKIGLLGFTGFGLGATALPGDVPMDEEHWDLRGTGEFVEFEGQKAVLLKDGTAILKSKEFQNGVIEFDMAFSEVRGFMGFNFRIQDSANYENFYFLSHQSGNPDANRYTPALNQLFGWQIYFGLQYSNPIEYAFDTWQHVKILVKGDAVEFYLDSDEPFLHIADLLNKNVSGDFSLVSIFNGTYFANFKITETLDIELKGAPVPHDPWPENLVEVFEVAQGAVPLEKVSGNKKLPDKMIGEKDWVKLSVERNGIANLARINGISEEAATTLVRLRVRSETDQIKTLKFGYSDKVSVFLNGQPIAGGDNTYKTRDYRYLGTVGLFDEVYLNLKKGENEIIFAVTEAFGGWAITGAFDDMEGIAIDQ